MLKSRGIRYKDELPTKERRVSYPSLTAEIKETVRAVIAGLAPWPLFLTGDAGGGKTCLGLLMIDIYGGWFLTAPELCKMLILASEGQLTYSTGYKRTEEEIWRDIRQTNLLVLDELGTRDVSHHHHATVKAVLDVREGRPTACISNLSLTELGKLYDDRIASRLAFGTTIRLKGDRRLNRTPKQENADGDMCSAKAPNG